MASDCGDAYLTPTRRRALPQTPGVITTAPPPVVGTVSRAAVSKDASLLLHRLSLQEVSVDKQHALRWPDALVGAMGTSGSE